MIINNKLQKALTGVMLCAVMFGLFFISCKRESVDPKTVNNPLIGKYLKAYPDKFYDFVKILDTTGYYSFLCAYGNYTCFAPTNTAIEAYATAKGKTSWRGFTMDELKNIVKFHVVNDTIATSQFTDGKIKTRNMLGLYLSTTVVTAGKTAVIRINKQANVLEKDIRVDNGVIHVIDNVLQPATVSIAKILESMPEYSTMTKVLKATGFYDTLDYIAADTSKTRWLTLLAESDAVLNKAGFPDYPTLYNRYCKTGNPKNPADSMFLFAAYHCLTGIKYVADIALNAGSALNTLAPLEIISVLLNGDTLLLNEDHYETYTIPGVPIVRDNSDIAAANGIINILGSHMPLRIKAPTPVYWDVTQQPEIMQSPLYRQPRSWLQAGNGYFPTTQGTNSYQLMTWRLASATSNTQRIGYMCAPITDAGFPLDTGVLTKDDCLFMQLRTGAEIRWCEFTTPVIVKGKYKVWMCMGFQSDNRDSRANNIQVLIDGSLLPSGTSLIRSYNFVALDPGRKTPSDDALFTQNYKRYLYNVNDSFDWKKPSDKPDKGLQYLGKLVGEITFTTTGTHIMRLNPIENLKSDLRLDMIHFIPSDQDQIWPKFNKKGQKVYKP